MRKIVSLFLPLLLLTISGCTDNAPKSTPEEEAKEQLVQTYGI